MENNRTRHNLRVAANSHLYRFDRNHHLALGAPSLEDITENTKQGKTTWPDVRVDMDTQRKLAAMEKNEKLTNWRLNDHAVEFIVNNLPKGSKILEFGSGLGSMMLYARGFELLSIEENAYYMNFCHLNYCLAEIKDEWYDAETVKDRIKGETFDAMIIDGPAEGKRSKILDHNFIDFDMPKFIIVDDIDREKDSILFNTLKQNKRHQLFDSYGVIFND